MKTPRPHYIPQLRHHNLLAVVLDKLNRIEILFMNINSQPHPGRNPGSAFPATDDLLDSRSVRILTRMSDRTLLRRRQDGTLRYYRIGGKIYYLKPDVFDALENSNSTK